MSSSRDIFVWTQICISTIYVVNVVSAVLMYVDNYVGILTHILALIYQLCVFGNPTLVRCFSTRFESSTKKLVIMS